MQRLGRTRRVDSRSADFDLVVSANGLHQLNNSERGDCEFAPPYGAAGGLAIVSEGDPAAFADVIFAGTKGWFDTGLWSKVLLMVGCGKGTTGALMLRDGRLFRVRRAWRRR